MVDDKENKENSHQDFVGGSSNVKSMTFNAPVYQIGQVGKEIPLANQTNEEIYSSTNIDKIRQKEKAYLHAKKLPPFSDEFPRSGDSLPICNEYFRNDAKKLFIFRDSKLPTLFTELVNQKSHVITGPPGVGKTTLALAYVHSFGSDMELYPGGVFWFEPTTKGQTPGATFKRFAESLGVRVENEDIRRQLVKDKIDELGKNKRTLFVFNGAEDYSSIKDYLDILGGTTHHIIITTCHAVWGSYKKELMLLGEFTREEALLFLKKHLLEKKDSNGISNEQLYIELAIKYHCNPLLLMQIVAHINDTCDGSLERYFKGCGLNIIIKDKRKIIDDPSWGPVKKRYKKPPLLGKTDTTGKFLDIHRDDIVETIKATVAPDHFKVLAVCVCFDSTYFPENFVPEFTNSRNNIIKHLKNKYLLESTENNHLKIPYAIKKGIKEILKYNYQFPASSNQKDSFITLDEAIEEAIKIIDKFLPKDFVYNKPFTEYKPYIAHGLALAKTIEKFITTTQLKDDKKEKRFAQKAAEIRLNCANIDFVQALYKDAADIISKAIDLMKKYYKENAKELIIYYRMYAQILERQKQFKEAEKFYVKAIQIYVSTPYMNPKKNDPYKIELAIAQSCLGSFLTYKAAHELSEAEEIFKDAEHYLMEAHHAKTLLCPKTPEYAKTEECLGELFIAKGDCNRALTHYEEAYNVNITYYSNLEFYKDRQEEVQKHPYVVMNQLRLGTAYYLRGRFAEAEQKLKPAADILEILFSSEHQDVIAAKVGLAKVYFWRGRYLESKEIFKNILSLKYAKIEPLDQNIIDAIYYTGRLLIIEGEYQAALTKFAEALNEQCKLCESSNVRIKRTPSFSETSKVRDELKKLGVTYYERIIHREIAKIIHYIGFAFYKLRQLQLAEVFYNEALSINHKTITKHPKALLSDFGIASVYYQQGRYVEAEKKLKVLLEEQKARYKEINDGKHFEIANTHRLLAKLYTKLARFSEAKNHLQFAWEIWKDPSNKSYSSLPEIALTKIAEAYFYWYSQRNYIETEKRLKEALEIQEKIYPLDHPNLAQTNISLGRAQYYQGNYLLAANYFIIANKKIEVKKDTNNSLDPDSQPALAELQHYLGDIYRKLGSLLLNESFLKKALESYHAALKFYYNDHPETITILCSMAKIAMCETNFDEAIDYLSQAEMIARKTYSESIDNHPHYAIVLINRGDLQFKNNNYESAFNYYSRAAQNLRIIFEELDTIHPKIIEAYCGAARAKFKENKDATSFIKDACAFFSLYYFKDKTILNDIKKFFNKCLDYLNKVKDQELVDINLLLNLQLICQTLIEVNYPNEIGYEQVTVIKIKKIVDEAIYNNFDELQKHELFFKNNTGNNKQIEVIKENNFQSEKAHSKDEAVTQIFKERAPNALNNSIFVIGGHDFNLDIDIQFISQLADYFVQNNIKLVYSDNNGGLLTILKEKILNNLNNIANDIHNDNITSCLPESLSEYGNKFDINMDNLNTWGRISQLSCSGIIVLPGGLSTTLELTELLLSIDSNKNDIKRIGLINFNHSFDYFMQHIKVCQEYNNKKDLLEIIYCSGNLAEIIDFIMDYKISVISDRINSYSSISHSTAGDIDQDPVPGLKINSLSLNWDKAPPSSETKLVNTLFADSRNKDHNLLKNSQSHLLIAPVNNQGFHSIIMSNSIQLQERIKENQKLEDEIAQDNKELLKLSDMTNKLNELSSKEVVNIDDIYEIFNNLTTVELEKLLQESPRDSHVTSILKSIIYSSFNNVP